MVNKIVGQIKEERQSMNDLVARLATGKHPVEFEKQAQNMEEINNRLVELKYVFVKFTDTRGGTELGINVDEQHTCIKNADFAQGTGSIHIEGTCILNYHKVRCIADVDLKTREGSGYLEVLADNNAENSVPFTKH